MDAGQIASIIVSLIAVTGVIASARASSKASRTNVATSSRVEMEKEAYERARKMDTETIAEQEKKIGRLKGEVGELETKVEEQEDDIRQLHYANDQLRSDYQMSLADNRRLREEVSQLRDRFTRLERGIDTGSTERIRIRETDTNPMGDYRNG